ncbi:MAG: pyruvate kinase [Bacteroidales bacterium]|nr:pyruvate kinase [Bacteroidales bacterium]MCF8336925.1 pyruvate kinase [Bacteroidales bacterium]
MDRADKKRTKIVATISDLKCDTPFIRSLYEEGMDVVRLNTAHQDREATQKVIENVRKASYRIALLLDTKGPEIRTVENPQLPMEVKEGDIIYLYDKGYFVEDAYALEVTYHNFVDELPGLGYKVLIDDGDIELEVKEKKEHEAVCVALSSGTIKAKKSINVPGARFKLPSLSEKDRDYIHFAIENNLDFIAHSFVRGKEDVLEIQKILDEYNSPIKIIAKIENREGVDNIDEILEVAYGMMVARGDLAIEIPYAKIPGIQRYLILKGNEKRKPVIVATQMLHTMIENPRPTRAEVTDIASAIYSEADAIMLSGETAYGKYPLESVQTMAEVASEVEQSKEPFYETPTVVLSSDISAYLSKSAVKAVARLNAKALIVDSYSGRTIRNIAAFRSTKPVFAMCYDERLVREMALVYGVNPWYLERCQDSSELIRHSVNALLNAGHVSDRDRLVIVAGNFGQKHGASFMEISSAENLKNY